ncbi:MAG TPA: hypothetical protein VHD31_03660 [Candidatus Paceibacterota bacterium]|nr:hypothetical protein [Candidatus Paceibacterota bacterium]
MPPIKKLASVEGALLALLGAGAFLSVLFALGFPFDHNEHMYLTAGRLLAEYPLYTAVGYVQMPLLPWIYSILFPVGHLLGAPALLVARLVTAAAFLGTVFFAVRIVYIWVPAAWFAYAIGCLVLFDKILQFAAREADADMLALLCWAAALYLWSRAIREHKGSLYFFSIGSLITGAALLRLFYMPLILLAIAAPFFLLSEGEGLPVALRRALWIVGGMVVSATPFLLLYGPHVPVVWDMVFSYHQLNAADQSAISGLSQKLALAYAAFSSPATWTGVLLVIVALWLGKASDLAFGLSLRARFGLFVLVLGGLECVLAFAPTPVWSTYFAPFLLFSVLGGAVLLPQAEERYASLMQAFCVGLIVINLPFALQQVVRGAYAWVHPSSLPFIAISTDAKRIDDHFAAGTSFATLTPGFLIDTDIRLLPQFASGPFLYRVGDTWSPQERTMLGIATPSSLNTLFAIQKPDAIMVGCEGELDASLEQYALTNSYQRIPGTYFGCARIYERIKS